MSGPAVRSRLLGLRARLAAARRGHALMDQKREVLLREIRGRAEEVRRLEASVKEALRTARRATAEARVALGTPALDAAVLAHPETIEARLERVSLVGVALPRLARRTASTTWRARAAPTAGCPALDRAGVAWTASLPDLLRLAEAEAALGALREGLARTTRRLNALEQAVIPGLVREIRAIVDALEEEERDEGARLRRMLGR